MEAAIAHRIEAPERRARIECVPPALSNEEARDLRLRRLAREQETWLVIKHEDGTTLITLPLAAISRKKLATRLSADGAIELADMRQAHLLGLLYELDIVAFGHTTCARSELYVHADLVAGKNAETLRSRGVLRNGLWVNPELPRPAVWRRRACALFCATTSRPG